MVGWIESISQIRRPYLGEDVPVLVFRAFRIFTGMYLEDTEVQRLALWYGGIPNTFP